MKSGYGYATIRANVADLLASGIAPRQAVATAYSAARVAYFKRFPDGALPEYLAYRKDWRLARYYDANGRPVTQFERGLQKNPAMRKNADVAKAAKLIEDFSGHKARVAGKINFPKNPGVGIAIGTVLGIAYETKRDGAREKYYHRFTLKSSRPLLVASKDGTQLFILGGEYDFTERGIVDRR